MRKFSYIIIIISLIYGYIFFFAPNKIKSIEIIEQKKSTELIIQQTRQNEPVVTYNKNENCWVLDFEHSIFVNQLDKKTLTSHFIKMAYLTSLKNNKKLVRLRIYLKYNSLIKVATDSDKVKITISQKVLRVKMPLANKFYLQNPSDKHLSPVFIDLKKQLLLPIIYKLAENIGVNITLSNSLPKFITLKLEASSSSEALIGITELLRIQITKTEDNWVLKYCGKSKLNNEN